MVVSNKPTEEMKEVDVIIAGGGTAGCVVAGRLAAGDPNLKILIIEGGTNNDGMENIVHPALFPEHVAEGSKTAIFYQTNYQKQLAGRHPIVPSGGVLGGGSSINLMLYTRGQRSDFDSWNMPGWNSRDLFPYLCKFECYHGPGLKEKHGFDGPVHVSDGGVRITRPQEDFIQAAGRVGYPEINDLQDLDSNNGVQRWLRYVSPSGKRQDAAHTFVHPQMREGKVPNLHILVEQKIVRVLFDENKKAIGVEYQPNPHYSNDTQKNTAMAKKMVVVSSGACGSPSVLERSGIGHKDVLNRAGIKIVADVPGVGHDYQDHNLIFFPYKTYLNPDETTDALVNGRLDKEKYIADQEKILSWNTCDVAAKVNPTDAEVRALGPAFSKVFEKDFRPYPDRPVMLMAHICSYLGADTSIEAGQYASIANYTAYPYSRGHLHITGPGIMDPLDFSLGFFTDRNDIDLKKQLWAYKKQREIMRRTEYYRGEVASGHPRFDPNSKAAIVDLGPKDQRKHEDWKNDFPDIEYTPEDDEIIEQFLRERVETTWHSLGTAKMAPYEEMGAVDERLNVYGVKNLKVIDLSIVPENVAANTMNSALLVGEKGADLVAEDLGMKTGYIAPSPN